MTFERGITEDRFDQTFYRQLDTDEGLCSFEFLGRGVVRLFMMVKCLY